SFVAKIEPYSIAATPAYFTTCAVDYQFDHERPSCERWLQFLNDLWSKDPQSIDLLQEWFGYCLTPDTSQQKIMMLIGPKRSGKGTLARVLRSLVGDGNVCGPTLASLQTNFGLWPLLGKTVAMISDARLSGRSDQAVITERLLSISGEDAQTVDRKNLEPVTTKLLTRFMIISNELPRLQDSSGAFAGRMLILRLTESFYGREDRALTTALQAERAGILHWAIDGWSRLRQRGYFVQPESGEQLREQLDELSSPISAFVKECCVVGPGYQVGTDDFYKQWSAWCEINGCHTSTIQIVGRDLSALLPQLKIRQLRLGAHRHRIYEGIGLSGSETTF
ncbi:MAG TPA: phage/plasmid primase, P4 family, partial [Pirellula sp.]|nr:phage/plasmid primase, P4 family [Pirellula sp.]